MKKPTCTLYGGRSRNTKTCMSDFSFIHTSTKRKKTKQNQKKKKTSVNSYNLISNHFHANLKGKQLWNEAKFKFLRKRKNKLTNGHGGMIIQLQDAIFENIRNVQIQALQAVFICLLHVSLPFLCVFHLWFKRYRRLVVYNDVTRYSVTCCLTLRHVTENRYVKCPVHLFDWNIFHLLSYEQNLLTCRIAGKLMNMKKIKLYWK